MTVATFDPKAQIPKTQNLVTPTLAVSVEPTMPPADTRVKRVFIETQGCQMNVYDSEKMADVLGDSHGMVLTDNPEEADVLLMNTCSIREKAQEKVFSELAGKSLKRKTRIWSSVWAAAWHHKKAIKSKAVPRMSIWCLDRKPCIACQNFMTNLPNN